jgi:magnesium chelatase family protein
MPFCPRSPSPSPEVTNLYSITCPLPEGAVLLSRRPFCSPHTSISDAGLIGGSSVARPGEVSLAHHGVPRGPAPGAVGFVAKTRLPRLDELAEFRRDALEAPRQPLEDKRRTVRPP